MTRKILFLLESRATWGYSKNVLKKLPEFPSLEGELLVTGSHLSEEHGMSINDIYNEGYSPKYSVKLHLRDEMTGWSSALGEQIRNYAEVLNDYKPDLVMLFGDRMETFAMACCCAYSGIPIAHVQAGDISGHIDDAARHAIGKFSHVHLASCDDSAQRLIKMGEQPFRVFNVGAPQLDDLVERSWDFTGEIAKELEAKKYFLVLHHPVMSEEAQALDEIRNIFSVLKNLPNKVIVIAPNLDRGSKQLRETLLSYTSDTVLMHDNLRRDEYIKLLANCKALIGNSSSGILEAPTFQVPVVNIGSRQQHRPASENILHVDGSCDELAKALKKIDSVAFQEKIKNVKNLYGNGGSSFKILEIISNLKIDKKLLQKRITY